MSAILGELGSASLNTVGETVAFAAGEGATRAISPLSVAIAQAAWSKAPILALEALVAAAVAAEDIDQYDTMQTEASYTGVDGDRFKLLYDISLTAPGMGELLAMIRRGTIADDDFAHGLRKHRFEDRWDTALAELKTVRLTPAQIALGIVRSVVDDPGLLAVTLDTADSNIAKYPVWPGDAIAEAAAGGVDRDRLRVMVGEVGLPMGAQAAARAFFRSIITKGAYYQAILEGDTRPEWADAILEESRQIPTVLQFVEGELRGIITTEQRHAGAALHGMTADDSDLLFANAGRPLPVHQITTGLARGGTYGGSYGDVPEPYQDAIRRSAIRPEYAVLAHANRYTIPSYFILRAILQDGGMTEAEFATYGKQLGWPPDLADKAAAAIGGASTTTAGPYVKKAQTQLWSTTHRSYIAQESGDTDARTALTAAGVDASEIEPVLTLWQHERSLVRAQLTPTQVKKAIGQPGKDTAWATAQLLERGYSHDDATTFLAE